MISDLVVPPPLDDKPVTVVLYVPETGQIVGHMTVPANLVAANTPPGLATCPGNCDPDEYMVNIGTATIVLKSQLDIDTAAAAKGKAQQVEACKRQIADLESKQGRAVREDAIGAGKKLDGSNMTPSELKKQLTDIDDQIAALRAIINS